MAKKDFNRISFELMDGTHYLSNERVDRVMIRVDGVEFLKLIGKYEVPMMELEGRKEIREMRVYPPATRRTISILRGIADCGDGACTIADCECECWGCWPITAKIIRLKSIVKWKSFENDHRSARSQLGHWTYYGIGPFVFEREQYDRELSKIPADRSAKIRGRLTGY